MLDEPSYVVLYELSSYVVLYELSTYTVSYEVKLSYQNSELML